MGFHAYAVRKYHSARYWLVAWPGHNCEINFVYTFISNCITKGPCVEGTVYWKKHLRLLRLYYETLVRMVNCVINLSLPIKLDRFEIKIPRKFNFENWPTETNQQTKCRVFAWPVTSIGNIIFDWICIHNVSIPYTAFILSKEIANYKIQVSYYR